MFSKQKKNGEEKPPKVPFYPKKDENIKVSSVFVGEQRVTRSKTRFYAYYDVKQCFVRLPMCPSAETLAWLEETEPVPQPEIEAVKDVNDANIVQFIPANVEKIGHRRRMSVVGCGLYSVNKRIVEKGTDFLEKVPRNNNNIIKQSIPDGSDIDDPYFGGAKSNSTAGELALLGQESFDDENEVNIGENCVSASENIGISVDVLDSKGNSNDAINDSQEKSFEEEKQQQVNNAIEELSSLIPNVAITSAELVKQCKKKVPALLPLSKNVNEIQNVNANNTNDKPVLFNNFCPFRRLPNVPFSIGGRPRKRSKSVDFYASMPPPLETLFESEEEYLPGGMQSIGNQDKNGNGSACGKYFGSANAKDLSVQTPKTLAIVRKWIGNLDIN